MRRLVLKMSMSLDGFVGGPNGEIDWIFQSSDDASTAWTIETLSNAGLHIMGSRTFRDMAAYWPTSTEPFAAPMNELPKVVFSHRGVPHPDAAQTTTALRDANRAREAGGPPLTSPATSTEASWTGARVATGALSEEIAQLKRERGKDILAHGGARFARSLIELGLVDEYRLLIHPVALGRGLPLFTALPRPMPLKLVSATAFPAGAVAHVYREL